MISMLITAKCAPLTQLLIYACCRMHSEHVLLHILIVLGDKCVLHLQASLSAVQSVVKFCSHHLSCVAGEL